MLESKFDNNKTIQHNLLTIKGIGPHSVSLFCSLLGLSPLGLYKNLSEKKKDEIKKLIVKLSNIKNYQHSFAHPIGLNLTQFHKDRIKRSITLNTVKGLKHGLSLPTRGQRTRSNANTIKRFQP
jgi:small subunit ribosomal protein S13